MNLSLTLFLLFVCERGVCVCCRLILHIDKEETGFQREDKEEIVFQTDDDNAS